MPHEPVEIFPSGPEDTRQSIITYRTVGNS